MDIAKQSLPERGKSRRVGYLIFGVLSFIIMTLCFYTNILGIANPSYFNSLQDGPSSIVVNRVILSRNEGVFSRAGLSVYTPGDADEWAADYFNGAFDETQTYYPYGAQIGLAGITASALDKLLPLEGAAFLHFVKLLNCAATAFILALLALWLGREFGLLAAGLTVVASLFSYWVTLYAQNLYWVIWTLFLPFLTVLLLHTFEERTGKSILNSGWFFLAAWFTVFLRAACGYEFISTVLVASEISVVYYALKHRWGLRRYLIRSLWVGGGGLCGFLTAVGINLAQKTYYFGSFAEAWSRLATDIFKRTGFDLGYGQDIYQNVEESLTAPLAQVLNSYFTEGVPLVLNLRLSIFFLLLLLGGVLCFLSPKISPSIAAQKNRLLALAATAGISLLAPLSWLVLAKGHSYLHNFIDYMLWFVPSIFLILALLGATLQLLFLDLWRQPRPPLRQKAVRAVAVVSCLVVIGWQIYTSYQMWVYPENTKEIATVLQNGQLLYEDGNNRVFYHENILYFMVPKRYNTNLVFYTQSFEDPATKDEEEETVTETFTFQEKALNLPPWKSYRVAAVPLPEGYPFVQFGQNGYKHKPIWWAVVDLANLSS